MKDETRATISRVSLVVYMVLLVLSGFLMSTAGGRVVWFCVMGLSSLPALVAGPRKYRVLGIVALLAAMAMAGMDYYMGRRDMAEIRGMMEEPPKKTASGVWESPNRRYSFGVPR
jgi:hypothetical protein